jgi:hypothetical protein
MSRGPDVTTLLERALLASADAAGCPLRLVTSEMTRWASATFAGARHMLSVTSRASSALDAWLAALPETEFALRDHLVADLVVQSVKQEAGEAVIALEILTVEER